MNRKYDYLQEKEAEEPYNFVQDATSTNEDFQYLPQCETTKKKSRSMHVTINEAEPFSLRRYRQAGLRQRNHTRFVEQLGSQEQEDANAIKRNNFIYHRTIDKFKEQICSIRIKQGIQEIVLGSKIPKLISSLSSSKKMSSYTEKDVSGMERRLKNRLQLVEKLKAANKAKKSVGSLPAGSVKETIRQTLDRRISDINRIVNQDAGSINLKIQEMDPINQMHRIRMIVQKGHRELKLVGDEEHDNIEENIYEVRQLMRKYLKEA